jgi:alkylhydroperoxidase family enzyme
MWGLPSTSLPIATSRGWVVGLALALLLTSIRAMHAQEVALGATATSAVTARAEAEPKNALGWTMPLSDEAAWKQLPVPTHGAGQKLPSWIRMLARDMPRTAAAFLELDLAQRTRGPVTARLRSAMRLVAAKANGCKYTQAIAAADARRAGIADADIGALMADEFEGSWSDAERQGLEFALSMTVDSDGVTDVQFKGLVDALGEQQAASMVLHMAYANFQDRLLICLDPPLEQACTQGAIDVDFPIDSLVIKSTPIPASSGTTPASSSRPPPPAFPLPDALGKDVVQDEQPHTWLDYANLQARLAKQRALPTRLPIPAWDSFASKLPTGMFEEPSDIVWYKIAFGYADELAIPFEVYLRTAGSEIAKQWDRVYGGSWFWMVTDAVRCPYCMGHCEMNWEVAGMSPQQIATLSTALAGNDWSGFSESQQHGLAFARKLTKTPSRIDRGDIEQLQQGFGHPRALFTVVQCSRYNYMTRISNGFQLTLEGDNPFWQYYGMKPPPSTAATTPAPEATAPTAQPPSSAKP